MIRASQELSKESRQIWTEFMVAMQEKMAEWENIIPASIRQEVQNLEAIGGLIDELLQHCGQILVTCWVTDQGSEHHASPPHLSDLRQAQAVCKSPSPFAENHPVWRMRVDAALLGVRCRTQRVDPGG